jgi:hypothetical protein
MATLAKDLGGEAARPSPGQSASIFARAAARREGAVEIGRDRDDREARRRERLVSVAVRALVVESSEHSYREDATTVLDALLMALEPPVAEMVRRGVVVHPGPGSDPGGAEWYRPA